MRTVVYLITSPLSQRDYDRFGINNWLNKGWNTKVFDCTKSLNPLFWAHVNGEQLSVDYDGLTIFDHPDDAVKAIKQLNSQTIFIDLLGLGSQEVFIRAKAKKKGLLIRCNLGCMPYLKRCDPTRSNRLIKAIANPSKVVNFPRTMLWQFLGRPDYWVVAGSSAVNATKTDNAKTIHAHSFDYDMYLNNEPPTTRRGKDLVVFLDTDEAYHSDYVALGIKPHVTPAEYFKTIDSAMALIAQSVNREVVVAAHPRADYSKRQIKYSLPIIDNLSYDLIDKAYMVVSHGSTALQWAVLKNKSILLVTTNELQSSRFSGHTYGFAKDLQKSVVNLNQIKADYDWSIHKSVNQVQYQKYIDKYVKCSGSPEQPLWDIVINQIESDLY